MHLLSDDAPFPGPNLDLRRVLLCTAHAKLPVVYSGGDLDSDAGLGAASVGAMAPVIRLHPIRIKVITADAAYRERAWKVLSDLGRVSFFVTSLDSPDDIAELLRAEPADVVLLDATGCEPAARRVVAKLAETAPRTGVLVVCHHCTDAARALRALPKWGWTQDLRAGVEVAYRDGNPLYKGPLGPLRRRPQRLPGLRRLQ